MQRVVEALVEQAHAAHGGNVLNARVIFEVIGLLFRRTEYVFIALVPSSGRNVSARSLSNAIHVKARRQFHL